MTLFSVWLLDRMKTLKCTQVKCKPTAQVSQIAYNNTEHLVGSEDTRHYVIEKQLCTANKNVVVVNTLAPLPYYNLPAQIFILEKHHPSITLLGQWDWLKLCFVFKTPLAKKTPSYNSKKDSVIIIITFPIKKANTGHLGNKLGCLTITPLQTRA